MTCDLMAKSKTPALTLVSDNFKSRFPDVVLSKSERKAASVLWDEITEGLGIEARGTCELADAAIAQKLYDSPLRVQQAIMRATALRVLDPNRGCHENPFRRRR